LAHAFTKQLTSFHFATAHIESGIDKVVEKQMCFDLQWLTRVRSATAPQILKNPAVVKVLRAKPNSE
jgi:hypothetical protein